jgi:hypothetical protein
MANGLPLVDKNGKPCRINPNGQVTDSSGRVILGADGKAMALGKWETFEPIKVGATKTTVKDPSGKTAVLGLNAQLFDSKGNPIVSTTGAPVYFDGKTKSLIDNKGKAIRVDASGKIPGKIATLAYQTVTSRRNERVLKNYFFLKPAGHFGLAPVTFLVIFPLMHDIDFTTAFGAGFVVVAS